MQPILLRGKVQPGDQRGRTLGYPTANLNLHRHQVRDGAYISETRVADRWYPSKSFIGAAKTFGKTKRILETHILDQKFDLYGQWISVRLLQFIRPNQKFSTAKALVAAMQRDEQVTRQYHQQPL